MEQKKKQNLQKPLENEGCGVRNGEKRAQDAKDQMNIQKNMSINSFTSDLNLQSAALVLPCNSVINLISGLAWSLGDLTTHVKNCLTHS